MVLSLHKGKYLNGFVCYLSRNDTTGSVKDDSLRDLKMNLTITKMLRQIFANVFVEVVKNGLYPYSQHFYLDSEISGRMDIMHTIL